MINYDASGAYDANSQTKLTQDVSHISDSLQIFELLINKIDMDDLDKPMHIGQIILGLSKLLIYEFFYNSMI